MDSNRRKYGGNRTKAGRGGKEYENMKIMKGNCTQDYARGRSWKRMKGRGAVR